MSTDVSHVETPKDDASFGELEAIRAAAAGSVNTAEAVASEAAVEESKSTAEAEEGRKAEAGEEVEAPKETASAEAQVATEAVVNALAPGAQVAIAGAEMLSESRSNPKNSVDTKTIAKQTGGMVGRQATSFEDGFKKIKSSPNGNLDKVANKIQSNKTGAGVFEKSEIAATSLKGQGSCVASWKKMEESASNMQAKQDLVHGARMANEAVHARAIDLQAKAAPQQPGPGGIKAAVLDKNLKIKPPNFKEETGGDDTESWAGA